MAKKRFKPSKVTLFLGLTLVGVIILLMPQSLTGRLNCAFVDIFRFFLNIGSAAVYYEPDGAVSGNYVRRYEHERLWVAYSNLQAKLAAQKDQIEKLSKVRITEPDPASGLVIANIVNRRKHQFFINKGTDNNLRKGQYVLGDNAVIGYIEQTSPDISVVRLITSPACRLAVKISAPQVNAYINATMAGDGRDGCRIGNLRKSLEIKKGYSVYADVKAGLLQSPRIIGRISECVIDKSNPVLWDITVEPAYNFDNLNDVAVIVIKTEL